MTIEPQWWVSVIEVPAIAGLFWMIQALRNDLHQRIDRDAQRDSDALARTRDDLADFKLEVARTYVPLSVIRDVDRRLSEHLLRIEVKVNDLARTTARAPEDRP